MQTTNRIIGYIKPKETEIIKKEVSIAINISDLINAEYAKIEKIKHWLNTHKMFKYTMMCKKIGIDKGNFKRELDKLNPKIKIELISKIENELKNYGY